MRALMVVVSILFFSGCTTLNKAKQADALSQELAVQKNKMEKMKIENEAALEKAKRECEDKLAQLRNKKQEEVKEFVEKKNRELSDLEKAKIELEKRLSGEIGEYKAKLQMTERGLVVTFLSEIFFDSGKDIIKSEGENALQQVAEVLRKEVLDSKIAVEGHTDSDPIRYSGWKSNWELSSARSLAVVHFFIDQCGVSPERLSAVGVAEYSPVKSNETAEGKRQNRRVEIVILPSSLKKVK